MSRNIISIESPCREKWSNMKPSVNGRFCDVCSKSVTDFTKMSSREMDEYFRSNRSAANACGRFKPSQLNYRGRYPSLQKALIIITGSLLFLTSCGLFKPKQLTGAYSLKPGRKVSQGAKIAKS